MTPKVKTEIDRWVALDEVDTPRKVQVAVQKDAGSYDFMRAGSGHTICEHGDNAYAIIEQGGMIGCACEAWKYSQGNDICKHVVTLLDRVIPTQKPVSEEIARDLMRAGWVGGKDNLHPPASETSDPDGEDNEGSDPTPEEPPEPPEAPEEHDYEIARRAKEVYQTRKRSETETPVEPEETTPVEEPEETTPEEPEAPTKKVYTHPDGTEFNSAEKLLDYVDALKAEQAPPPAAKKRPKHKAMIKGISPRLQEIGRIAVGEKGGVSQSGRSRLPTKLDHFTFTTLEKDGEDRYIKDQGMIGMFGDQCTEIPIRLLYNDIELNFPTFYAKYARSGMKLRGDGENWTVYLPDGTREEVYDPDDTHGFLKDKDVKPHGILTVLVEGQNSVGGVYKFRTTSWNSINNILSSLAVIKQMCGMLTYIPLKLVYRKKTVQPVGMAHTTWIPVVSVEFRGSIEELQEKASEVRRYITAGQQAEMQQIESAVRDTLDDDESIETQQDIAAEFAPGVE